MRGSTLKKWKHQLKKSWWKGRTRPGPGACLQVTDSPVSERIYLASQMLQEGAVLQTSWEGVYSAVAKMQKANHQISHCCKRKISSHADPGSVLRKSCHRSQGRNRRSNPKHLTLSKKEGLWIGNAIFLSISMGEVNQSPPPTKIIPELKLTWNGKCIQMRFWSDIHFKYKKKQIRSNLALVWIKTITTKSGP